MQKYSTIDAYIANYPPVVQALLKEVRKTIHEAVPEATEAIAYGIPTFKLNGNMVHFAAHAKHIGFYPAPSGLEAFAKDLEPYLAGKGTAQFPLDKPIPYDLIRKISLFRAEENRLKKKTAK